MRMLRTGVRAVAASVVAVLLLTVPAIGATGVITTKADEFNPAATDTYIAWNVYTHRHYVVYAKQFGGSRFRVNPSGTEGWVGSIEGTTLDLPAVDPLQGNVGHLLLRPRGEDEDQDRQAGQHRRLGVRPHRDRATG